jgi:mannose/fructose/sorbose-specific phosphotransferase system IIA component
MIGIVIVTHGKMALELANSVKMVFGSLDHVHPVCFTADMELDDLQEEVRKVAEGYADQPLIFMTDMFGGSAFNVSSAVMKKGIDILVAGVNMPLLLDVLFSRDAHDIKSIQKEIINDMAKYIVIYEGGA